MDFSRWLASWLTRHPVKEPLRMGSDYTREVISKLTVDAQPARPVRRWSGVFFHPAYALVSAVAIVLIVTALVRPQPIPAPQLAAETPTEDETWIQQTMQLLEQLEQTDDASGHQPTQSDEEWLQELEMIDDADLATAS